MGLDRGLRDRRCPGGVDVHPGDRAVLTSPVAATAGGRLQRWARALRRDVHAIYLSARNPRVPWYAKAVAMLVAAYAISPIDLIPDFIPVLGYLDDLILVPLGIMLAVRLIPAGILEEHRRAADAIAEKPIDWRVGALFIAIWLVVLALVVRWLIGVFYPAQG